MAQKKNQSYIRHLHRASLPAGTIELAKYLIGKTLVHDTRAGRAGSAEVAHFSFLRGS